jgi:GntR family transcriptional repressor for pyruvate dehydrogenase complex
MMDNHKELLTPVKQQKVYTQVVGQIIQLINSGELIPGTKLTGERDLARHLGISRGSLREALTALQIMGYVEVKQGQGAYICNRMTDSPNGTTSQVLDEESPIKIIEARLAIEPNVAAYAAIRRSKKTLETLEEIINSVHDEVSPDYYAEKDRLFHFELSIATENPVLIEMQHVIYNLMGQNLWRTLIRNSHDFSAQNRWKIGFHEHVDILEAIQKKDPVLASKRVEHHLNKVKTTMIKTIP